MKMLIGGDFALFADSIAYFSTVRATNNETKVEDYIVVAVLRGAHGPLDLSNICIKVISIPFSSAEMANAMVSELSRLFAEGYNRVYVDEVIDRIEQMYAPTESTQEIPTVGKHSK